MTALTGKRITRAVIMISCNAGPAAAVSGPVAGGQDQ